MSEAVKSGLKLKNASMHMAGYWQGALFSHLLLAARLVYRYNTVSCRDYSIVYMEQGQRKDETLVKTTVRIPQWVIEGLKAAGKLHRRNFNNELVVALEEYLKN